MKSRDKLHFIKNLRKEIIPALIEIEGFPSFRYLYEDDSLTELYGEYEYLSDEQIKTIEFSFNYELD